MKNRRRQPNPSDKTFLDLFIEVGNLEECPSGVDLLVWDGCDFSITYVTMDEDSGCYYDASAPEEPQPFIAYMVLPKQDKASEVLGDGE